MLRHRRLGPLIAASVTMPPGCGGAIIVMALYARGAVSYGAAIAALVATMGDASWVLLAADPVLTVQLKVVLLVTGAATGYAVDALGIAPRRRVDAAPATPATSAPPVTPIRVAPAPRAPAFHLYDLGVLPVALWMLIGTGATISVPVTFQLLDPSNLYLGVGVVGTGLAV